MSGKHKESDTIQNNTVEHRIHSENKDNVSTTCEISLSDFCGQDPVKIPVYSVISCSESVEIEVDPVSPDDEESNAVIAGQLQRSNGKGRVRIARPETWAENVRKRKRNLGQAYVSKTTKKLIPAKKIGPPCNCSEKCFQKLGHEALQTIFNSYWSMGDYNIMTTYIQDCIERIPVGKRRKGSGCKKSWNFKYFVTYNRERINICKTAFLSIHKISSTRVAIALQKISDGKHKESDTIQNNTVQHRIHSENKDNVSTTCKISLSDFCGQDPVKKPVYGVVSCSESVEIEVDPVSPDDEESNEVIAGQLQRSNGKGRVRIARPETWAENVRKRKRNLGQAYVSKTKKLIPAKKIGPPCNCSEKCFQKLGHEALQIIFNSYWSMGDYNIMTTYIQDCIERIPVGKRRKGSGCKKSWNLKYFVTYNQERINICKTAFLSIHKISSTRVTIALQKISDGGTPVGDKRGKKRAHKYKCNHGRVLECVHEHIQSLPVVTSRYTRAKSQTRQYLESHFSIQKLYRMYTEWMIILHPDVEQVKMKYYNKIFSRDYNIGFQPVKVDLCNLCEKIEICTNDDIVKDKDNSTCMCKMELNEHLQKKNDANNAINAAKEDTDDNWLCICMDLQQSMPCPRLPVGLAYYKRKMWLYNFCIHNLKTKESFMFVWEENVAARGSNEIASCLQKWLELNIFNKPNPPKKLKIFADNCGGQNKNVVLILAALREVHAGNFERIEFTYPVPGHSYMVCDSAFGLIENNLRRHGSILSPALYCNTIANSRIPRYPVYHMQMSDFLDYGSIICTKRVVKRAAANNFSKASVIVVCSQYRQGYILKNDYNVPDDEGTKVSALPGQRSLQSFDLGKLPVPQKYPQERNLQPKKLKDLRSLLDYMGSAEKKWLVDLLKRQESLPTHSSHVETVHEKEIDDYDNIHDWYEDVVYYHRALFQEPDQQQDL